MLQEDGSLFFPDYNVVVYPDDDAQLNKYYYTNTQPRLRSQDGNYRFTLIGFEPPTQESAGALSLVVDLSVESEVLEAIAKEISPDNPPQLAPIPWMSGTAILSLVSSSNRYVAQPSLIGDNAVVFNMLLSLDDFILLQSVLCSGKDGSQGKQDDFCQNSQLLEDPPVPISIIYNLTYASMRQSLKCSATMTWDRFYTWHQKTCEVKIIFINFNITEIVEELKEEQAVEIECASDGAEHETALELVKLIADSFFTPLPIYEEPAPGGNNGWGLGFSCVERDYTEIAHSFLNFDMNTEVAVSRRMYLQGQIEDLGDAYDQNKIEFIRMNLESPFEQDLTIYCNADFAADQIYEIYLGIYDKNGDLVRYINPNPHRFTDNETWSVTLIYDPYKEDGYSYQYTVDFHPDTYRDPLKIPNKVRIERGEKYLAITPRDYYTVQPVPVRTGSNLPWELMQAIIVNLKLADQIFDTIQLEGEEREKTWFMYRPQPNDFDFYYKVTYNTGSKLIKTNWIKSATIIHLDPFTERTVFFLAGQVNWTRYNQVMVFVECINEQEAINGKTFFLLTEESEPIAEFTYYYIQSEQKEIKYSAIYFESGGSQTLPEQRTQDTYVTLPASPEVTSL
ncbi:hypothetical protein [Coleofasciculus sp. F4-SAH-05]|uniref:hypothetical protein n=1 Tax=unclassified Coleofasciculus TaxID=2692782 RepID=UPI0032F35C04